MSHLFGSCAVCDVSHDITLCSTSFLLSEGPDVCGTGGVGTTWVVIRDPADSSLSTVSVGISTVGFDVSRTIAKDTLVNLGASLHGVSCTHTPLTIHVLVIWAVLPTIGEVGNSHIEYGRGDVRREGGIMEDVWLKAAEHIGMSQHAERVVLLPLCVPIEFLEPHQVFSEVCHPFMGVAESLYLPSKGCVSFAVKGEVDHGQECFIQVEGVGLLLCEYSMGVGIQLGTKWPRMFGAIMPMGEYNLQVVWSKVIMEERGDDFPSHHSWDAVVDQGFQPLEVSNVVGAIGRVQPLGEQPDKRRSLDGCKDILELISYSLSRHNPAPS